jgi:hypothetical protein
LFATTLTRGTGHLIEISGATNTFTLTGSGTNGAGSNSIVFINSTSGSVVVNGDFTGGDGNQGHALYIYQAASFTCTGNLTGGSGKCACGALTLLVTTVTLNSGNLIAGAGGMGYAGVTPTWNKSAENYIRWGTAKYSHEPGADNMLSGVVCGDQTGTVTLPAVDKVQYNTYYGNPVTPLVGTLVARAGGPLRIE